VRDLARIYSALLRAGWAEVIEYRAQALLWILSGVFPLVMMVVWLAIVDEAGPRAGWTYDDFVSYYLGAWLVNQFTVAFVVWDWDDDIRTGDLSVKLLKPMDPFHSYFTNQLRWKILVVLLILPIFLVVAWLTSAVHYPLTPAWLAAFVLSLIVGFFVGMFMSCAFAVLAFWSTQVANLYSLFYGVGQFLSGWIAPLALFPESIRNVAYLLPFRSLISFPLEILMGRLTWSETGFGFAVSGVWILIFLIIYRVLWHIGLRRYEAVGA
jgi:ABC-2 type transport system permease protein